MNHSNLWAPWRMRYIKAIDDDSSGCFLCDAAANGDDDAGRLVLQRDSRGLILLNRYPYVNGHLLVAPSDHLGDLTDMSPEQRGGLMELIAQAEQLVKVAFNPQGVNIGINVGRAAGAGLPGHLHAHIVPRWSGDTNFMTVVGQVRVVPQALEEAYDELRRVMTELA